MYYMTLLHWIAVALFIVIFLILSLLAIKETKFKTALSMILISFVLVILGIVFSLFILDKYTKKAKLLNVKHSKITLHESIQVRGSVKNIGNFKIGYCNLELKIINIFTKKIQKGSMFAPRTSFGEMFSKENSKIKSNFVEKTFKIAKNLKPNESQKFSVSLKYPSYFEKPIPKYKLFCY